MKFIAGYIDRKIVTMLLTMLLGLVAGGVMMELAGDSAVSGYTALFMGALMSMERLGDSVAIATPLIFSGLSVAVAYKTGLFNIGAAGQMLIGGLCATIAGLSLTLPKLLILPLMIGIAAISGAIWGGLAGWLKARYNVHEVVSTIMLNWIAYWLVYYTIPAYFRGNIEVESKYLPQQATLRMDSLNAVFGDSYINSGIFLALIAVYICYFIMENTNWGFAMKASGFNPCASVYAGINVQGNIVSAMMLAGALSGLAGLSFYCGYMNNIQIGIMPQQGFDALAVALLGNGSPVGVLFAALFFGMLDSGRGFMSAVCEIPAEISEVIIAVIIYFTATGSLVDKILLRLSSKKQL